MEKFETILRSIVKQPELSIDEIVRVLAEQDKLQRVLKERELKTANLERLKGFRRKAINASTET
jgi:hypothetical protein